MDLTSGNSTLRNSTFFISSQIELTDRACSKVQSRAFLDRCTQIQNWQKKIITNRSCVVAAMHTARFLSGFDSCLN
jgi:hypothetical protein